jgi:APA family basic amino acid/polyamine antiporter
MTILGALSYAELAAMMPHAGGQYVYLREAYGPLWAFLYGWTAFLVIQTGTIAAVGVAFAKFLGVHVPALGTDPNLPETIRLFQAGGFTITAGQLVGVAVIALLTALNCLGVREGKTVQNVFTVGKTLALVLMIVVGLFVVASPTAWNHNAADWFGGAYHTKTFAEVAGYRGVQALGLGGLGVALMVMGGAMVGALFSADAWNNVTFTAGEVRNPRRTLPLSLALGTGLVITLYLLANVAYLRSLPVHGEPELDAQVRAGRREADRLDAEDHPEEAKRVRAAVDARLAAAGTFDRGIAYAKDARVGTAVMELWSPGLGTPLMAVAIMISTFGCANGLILMGARLYYVMARDGLFFRQVGTLNGRGVPQVGLVLQGVWASVLVFTGKYGDLLDYVIFAVLVFYALTVTGLFVLRRTRPDAERPYRAVGYPVLPGLYVVLCTVVMLDLLVVKPMYTWPGLGIVLTGIPVYFLWRGAARRA